MHLTLDEIYALLSCGDAAQRQLGIRVAEGLTQLYPFILPRLTLPLSSRAAWQGCAELLALRSDEALAPHVYGLLAWLQDMTCPGAAVIYDRLQQMPWKLLAHALLLRMAEAQQLEDDGWLICLRAFEEEYRHNHA